MRRALSTCTKSVHRDRRIGQRVRIAIFAESLGLAARTVLVVRMLLHVLGSKTFGLVNERALLILSQQFPFRTFKKKC